MSLPPATAGQRAHYFQVPLCAFAFGRNHKERFEHIIAFAAVEAGRKRWGILDATQREQFLAARHVAGSVPSDYDPRQPDHHAALSGAGVTGIRIGTMHSLLSKHAAVCKFRDYFQQLHGADPSVRLKTEFVFEARDGLGITPQELSALAAIYSVVGAKQGPVRITQDRIRHRMLGYKTKNVMTRERRQRSDGAQPLSDWQLRSLLDRLQTRKFFARVTFGRRLSYYSHRMSEAELRKAVIQMKTFQSTSRQLRRQSDDEMSELIRQQRAALAGHPRRLAAARAC